MPAINLNPSKVTSTLCSLILHIILRKSSFIVLLVYLITVTKTGALEKVLGVLMATLLHSRLEPIIHGNNPPINAKNTRDNFKEYFTNRRMAMGTGLIKYLLSFYMDSARRIISILLRI